MPERDCLRNGDWKRINYYPVSVEKLQQASMREAAYLIAPVNIGEDYEYFDEVKHLLIIPEPHKSIEELQQELDEKFEKLIEQTKEKFNNSYNWDCKLRRYKEFCEKQDSDFSYSLEHGYFPQITFLDSSKFTISNKFEISSPCFMVKHGSNHQGYYTIGDDGYYRFYMEKKPNVIFRWFVYKLMGFQWIDEVLK